jgi:hypothetical protein
LGRTSSFRLPGDGVFSAVLNTKEVFDGPLKGRAFPGRRLTVAAGVVADTVFLALASVDIVSPYRSVPALSRRMNGRQLETWILDAVG